MPTVDLEQEDSSCTAIARNDSEATEASDIPNVRSDVPSLPSCKSNELISKFSDDGLDAPLDPHQFKSAFIQVVEELRMRRTIDVENDRRIQQLVDENHGLKKRLEEEKAGIGTLMEKHSRAERNLSLKCEEKVKQTENQKAKTRMQGENWEQELKSLKDKIRSLHLVKYSLEKKVTEQGRQLQLQSTSRGGYLSQMNDLDQKLSEVLNHADVISEQMEKVETNVKASKDLHVKLQYINEHHNCELEACRSRLEDCRAELMEARMKVVETMLPECIEIVTSKTKANDQELKMQTELNKQLQDQLSSLRKEHQEVLRQLKDAHSLIEKHAESLITATQNEEELCKEAASLHEKINSLKQGLDNACKAEQSIREESTKEKEHWLIKHKDIDVRLKSLQEDYKTQEDTHCEELEMKANQLATAKKSITQLNDEIVQLQDQLISAKTDMNIMKDQLERVTTNSQCIISQHSDTICYSPKAVNPQSSPVVPCPRSSPDVFEDSPPTAEVIQTNVMDAKRCQEQEMSPLVVFQRIEEKLPPVFANNSQKSSPIVESKSTFSKTESPPGKKRRNSEQKTDCPSKKVCIEANAIIEEKKVLTTKDCWQASPLLVQISTEKVLTNVPPSLVLDKTNPAAEIQAIPTDVNMPQSMSVNLPKSPHSESHNLDSQIQMDKTQTTAQPSITCAQTDATLIETNSQATLISHNLSHDVTPSKTEGALSTTLPVMFSDDEDSANEDKLWDTQLNEQIDKVQMFLKLDKLRRPKKNC